MSDESTTVLSVSDRLHMIKSTQTIAVEKEESRMNGNSPIGFGLEAGVGLIVSRPGLSCPSAAPFPSC
jgi:hypothetical protein